MSNGPGFISSGGQAFVNRGAITGGSQTEGSLSAGWYRVDESGYGNALLHLNGIGGSTPAVQLYFNYSDEMYIRFARDSETQWDGVSRYAKRVWHSSNLTNLSQLSNGPGYVVNGQSSVTFTDIYNNGWFRNNNANQGLYNQALGTHFASNGTGSWQITGNGGNIELQFRANHNSTLYGYVYGNTSSNFGLLNSSGNWQLRIEAGNANMELYRVTYGDDMRGYIWYARDDTSYYLDANTWSRLWGIGTFYVRNNYDVSVDHPFGIAFSNDQSSAYRIYREGGGWSFPYPDLRIAFHTGLKFGANPGYEGMRFYTDYDMSGRVMQVNGSSNYIYMDRWINVVDHQGIYSSMNGAHIYPNNGDYGSWRMDGTRNGWYGIYFASGSTLMMNDGDGGIHRSGNGWRIYHSGNNLYARGEVTAYWSDRRLKQNIKPLEKGSGLALIDRLIPSSFEWNELATKVNDGFYEGQAETALIAQEVQEILPIAVAENKAGRCAGKDSNIESYLTVKYDKITPFLIQAIKDLKAEIDELKEIIKNGTN